MEHESRLSISFGREKGWLQHEKARYDQKFHAFLVGFEIPMSLVYTLLSGLQYLLGILSGLAAGLSFAVLMTAFVFRKSKKLKPFRDYIAQREIILLEGPRIIFSTKNPLEGGWFTPKTAFIFNRTGSIFKPMSCRFRQGILSMYERKD